MLSKAWVPRNHVVHHCISCRACTWKSTLVHSHWCSHSHTYIHTCMTVSYVNHLLSISWSFFSHWRSLICANKTPTLLLFPWGCAECASCWHCRDPSSRGGGAQVVRIWAPTWVQSGFPGGWWVKNLPAMQETRGGFNPWVRKIIWRRAWQPTPVFLPGESHGQRSLVGYGP